jgi:hypothetical protein
LCWAKHQTEGGTAITRLTIDARECNKALVGDMPEALPTTANPMQHAEGGYVYSTIDLVKAFWQSRIFPPHASRAALRIAGQNCALKKIFFGMRFGSSTAFQQLLQDIVGEDLFQLAVTSRAVRARRGGSVQFLPS